MEDINQIQNRFKINGQDYKIITDNAPGQGSTNLISSGAVYEEISQLEQLKNVQLTDSLDGIYATAIPTVKAVKIGISKAVGDSAIITDANHPSFNQKHNIIHFDSNGDGITVSSAATIQNLLSNENTTYFIKQDKTKTLATQSVYNKLLYIGEGAYYQSEGDDKGFKYVYYEDLDPGILYYNVEGQKFFMYNGSDIVELSNIGTQNPEE